MVVQGLPATGTPTISTAATTPLSLRWLGLFLALGLAVIATGSIAWSAAPILVLVVFAAVPAFAVT